MKKHLEIMRVSNSWMYLNNTKPFIYEIIEGLMYFLSYYPVVAVLIYFIEGSKSVLLGTMMLPVILCMMVCGRLIKNGFLYFLAMIVISILGISVYATIFMKCMAGAVFLINIVSLLKHRLSNKAEYMQNTSCIFCVGMLAVAYVASILLGYNFMKLFIMYDTIILTICYGVYFNTSRTAMLLNWEPQYAQSFMKTIKKVRWYSVSIIVMLIVATNFIMYKTGVYYLIDKMDNGFWGFFKRMTANKGVTPPKPQQSTKPHMEEPGESIIDKLGTQSKTTNPVIKFILEALKVVMWIIVIAILLYLVVMLVISIVNFIKSLDMNKTKKEKRETVIPFKTSAVKLKNSVEKIKNNIYDITDTSNKRKIRRIYEHFVEGHRKRGIQINQSYTPYEIEDSISKNTESSINEITAIYENARYGNEDCTVEDLKKIKNYTSRKGR